ncbi:tRNA (adenosine(37)-N6)-threonylcarbamoyltransferase complex ATPase subunit type 1 TsaE [bacterium]|nr:tRNA (adenosine(37)-N6)-threonylcarbamoyltransferase complex ATPase subunit type 1 TsaE [bacterium]
MDNYIEWFVTEEQETKMIAEKLGAVLRPNDVVAFYGELGTGKTFMSQIISAALGVTEHVSSPSFAIIQEYVGSIPVYHFDLYRLQNIYEVADLGFEDYLERNGVCLIEWPQIAVPLLPDHTINVKIDFLDTEKQHDILLRRIRVYNLNNHQKDIFIN